MPETAAPAAPQPVTVVVTDQNAVDAAAREALDAKAWESITGTEPDGTDIPTPDFDKLEAEGKTEATPRGPDGKFVKGEKPETEPEPEGEKEPADKKPEPK